MLNFGVGPFSYVRYYTFAPAFLALVGFFALMAIFVRVLAAGAISIRLLLGSVRAWHWRSPPYTSKRRCISGCYGDHAGRGFLSAQHCITMPRCFEGGRQQFKG